MSHVKKKELGNQKVESVNLPIFSVVWNDLSQVAIVHKLPIRYESSKKGHFFPTNMKLKLKIIFIKTENPGNVFNSNLASHPRPEPSDDDQSQVPPY